MVVTAVWVICWVPFAVALDHVLMDILVPEPRLHSPYTPVRIWAIWGALSGLGFALVTMVLERGRQVSSLSIPRVLSWGAIGSALVPILYYIHAIVTFDGPVPGLGSVFWRIVLLTVAISAVLGIISALCTLALVRAGTAGDRTHPVGAA